MVALGFLACLAFGVFAWQALGDTTWEIVLTRDLARAGVTLLVARLLVARLKSGVRQRFDEGGVTAVIGPGRFHPTVRAAVAACRAEDHAVVV